MSDDLDMGTPPAEQGSPEFDLPTRWHPVEVEHTFCVVYCRGAVKHQRPGRGRNARYCPYCHGRVAGEPIHDYEIDPVPTRAERFAVWVAGWVAAFLDGLRLLHPGPAQCAECARRELIEQASREDERLG